MVSTEFVFLNATGDHGLSSHAARQMRAHITRTNFAKRRQRIAGGKQKDAAGEKRSVEDELVRDVLSRADVLAAGLPFLAQPQGPYRYAQNREIFMYCLFVILSDDFTPSLPHMVSGLPRRPVVPQQSR